MKRGDSLKNRLAPDLGPLEVKISHLVEFKDWTNTEVDGWSSYKMGIYSKLYDEDNMIYLLAKFHESIPLISYNILYINSKKAVHSTSFKKEVPLGSNNYLDDVHGLLKCLDLQYKNGFS